MKKKFLTFILTLTAMLMCIFGFSACAENSIIFNTLTVDGKTVYGIVSNATAEFSFIDEVTAKGNATYVVDNDKDCNSPIYSKTVDLVVGDNVFYVLEIIGNDVELYTVTIRRRPMYEVTFYTNGGTSIEKQVVEEGFFAIEPINPERDGYAFTGWDYDFAVPITASTKIKANWTSNPDTKYTVAYYLQNLDDNNYTLYESVGLEGETGMKVTADIKEYAHFTYNAYKSTVSGNINGNGSCVLSVYYTRNTYTLSINDSSAGYITNSGAYKYGAEDIVSTVTPYIGYNFLGWYSGENLLSTQLSYTFSATQNITAQFEVKPEMLQFNFIATETICAITGVKDKMLTGVIIPDYVTSICEMAFSNCSSMTSVVIGDSVTSIGERAFHYCSSLTSVVIPDGVTSIGYGTFRYCSSLTSVVIPNSVMSIDAYAFDNCSSLTSVVIPDSVTSIGGGAFHGCSSLTEITLPFVGATKGGTSYTHFGYIFGAGWYYENSSYVPDSLKKVTVTSATSIDSYAFAYCSGLTSVVIPDSVTSIGERTFYNCDSLLSIKYCGSQTQWSAISKGSDWDSNTGAYTITYDHKDD